MLRLFAKMQTFVIKTKAFLVGRSEMDNKFALGISLGVLPTEEIFSSLAAAGISCAEISVLGEGRERLLPESENIRAMARRYGICLWSMHLPFGREEMNFCAPDAE